MSFFSFAFHLIITEEGRTWLGPNNPHILPHPLVHPLKEGSDSCLLHCCVGTSPPACPVATDVDMSDEPHGSEWIHLWALVGESVFMPGFLFLGERGAPGKPFMSINFWKFHVTTEHLCVAIQSIYRPCTLNCAWRFLLHSKPSGKVPVHWPSEPFCSIYYFGFDKHSGTKVDCCPTSIGAYSVQLPSHSHSSEACVLHVCNWGERERAPR